MMKRQTRNGETLKNVVAALSKSLQEKLALFTLTCRVPIENKSGPSHPLGSVHETRRPGISTQDASAWYKLTASPSRFPGSEDHLLAKQRPLFIRRKGHHGIKGGAITTKGKHLDFSETDQGTPCGFPLPRHGRPATTFVARESSHTPRS